MKSPVTNISADAPWGTLRVDWRTRALLRGFRAAPLFKRQLRDRLLRRLGDAGVGDIDVDGLRYRVHVHDNASERKLFLTGRRKDRAQLAQILNALNPGSVFVDIGANFGLYTLPAARRVGSEGRVVAIEPNPIMAQRLKFNLTTNGFANVHVYEVAVGAQSGEAVLSADPNQYGKGSLARVSGSANFTVPVRSLVELLDVAHIQRIDALKIDIEGYEDRALCPFFEMASPKLWPLFILIESKVRHLWHRDCILDMLDRGYHVTWEGRDDTALTRAPIA